MRMRKKKKDEMEIVGNAGMTQMGNPPEWDVSLRTARVDWWGKEFTVNSPGTNGAPRS